MKEKKKINKNSNLNIYKNIKEFIFNNEWNEVKKAIEENKNVEIYIYKNKILIMNEFLVKLKFSNVEYDEKLELDYLSLVNLLKEVINVKGVVVWSKTKIYRKKINKKKKNFQIELKIKSILDNMTNIENKIMNEEIEKKMRIIENDTNINKTEYLIDSLSLFNDWLVIMNDNKLNFNDHRYFINELIFAKKRDPDIEYINITVLGKKMTKFCLENKNESLKLNFYLKKIYNDCDECCLLCDSFEEVEDLEHLLLKCKNKKMRKKRMKFKKKIVKELKKINKEKEDNVIWNLFKNQCCCRWSKGEKGKNEPLVSNEDILIMVIKYAFNQYFLRNLLKNQLETS